MNCSNERLHGNGLQVGGVWLVYHGIVDFRDDDKLARTAKYCQYLSQCVTEPTCPGPSIGPNRSPIAHGSARTDQSEPKTSTPAPLLPAQRRQRIVEFLRRHGAVTLQQLEQALHVSMSTLRRDLDALAVEGEVDRTHGGALLRHQEYSTFEPDHARRRNSPRSKSRRSAGPRPSALLPRQSVIFDSGSTVLEAARAVVQRNIPLTAVTNNLAIAQVLGTSPLIQVHVLRWRAARRQQYPDR